MIKVPTILYRSGQSHICASFFYFFSSSILLLNIIGLSFIYGAFQNYLMWVILSKFFFWPTEFSTKICPLFIVIQEVFFSIFPLFIAIQSRVFLFSFRQIHSDLKNITNLVSRILLYKKTLYLFKNPLESVDMHCGMLNSRIACQSVYTALGHSYGSCGRETSC